MGDVVQSVSNTQDTDVSNADSGKEKKETVDYASFKKVLTQKKATDAKLKELSDELAALRAAKANEDDKKNRDAGEWQKVIEARDAQINDLTAKLNDMSSKYEQNSHILDNAVKLNAVYSKLPGKIKNPKYAGFIDLDKVAVNPETGDVDMQSALEVANAFAKDHRELLDTKDFRHIPGDSPSSTTISTADTFKTRPLKEMRQALPEAVRDAKRRMGITN